MDEQLKEPGWHYLHLFPISVDEYGHELSDGTYYEPTFKRNFKLVGIRSDGTHFMVNIVFDKDVDLDLLKLIGAKFANGIMTFESYRTCECVVGKPCEKHANG